MALNRSSLPESEPGMNLWVRAGRTGVPITDGQALEDKPRWSPDGKTT